MRTDINKICNLPFDGDAKRASVSKRNATTYVHVSGRMVLKENYEREVDQDIVQNINPRINEIWNLHLTPAQRKKFDDFADEINKINNEWTRTNDDSRNRMKRINNQQQGHINSFGDDLFSGVSFP
ncbi:hypothetical protein C1645_731959 [Glomus cerebriforme]|uniref:Uncharacterized protein n=1 Tax=Glomus cerebriforme TaxID=658196 RepID=A0A397TJ92_9GLOM|nr:hypothetical protein C1645_731959 [Glomus cerebriforme]